LIGDFRREVDFLFHIKWSPFHRMKPDSADLGEEDVPHKLLFDFHG